MTKQRTPAQAMKTVSEATDLVVEHGGVIHESSFWDAHEMALDGASKQSIAERIMQDRAEPYQPKGGWRTR